MGRDTFMVHAQSKSKSKEMKGPGCREGLKV